MKRLILAAAVITMTVCLSAQTHIGVRGHMANTWILNTHISDAGDELDYKGSYAGGGGLMGIVMFTEKSGVGVGIGLSRFEQQTQGKFGTEDYVNLFQIKYTDINLFYTHIAEGQFFFELGPQISLRKDNIDETGDFTGDNETKESLTDPNLNSTTLFGVMGMGAFFPLNDELKMLVSARLGYGLTDLTNELSIQEYNDLDPDRTSSYTYLAQDYNSQVDPDDFSLIESTDYKATTPAFLSFNVGLFYTIE